MLERGACTFPLARRQPRQGEQPLAGFLQAVGDSARLEPPLADEGSGALSRVVSALQRPCDFSHRLKYRTLASNAREASVPRRRLFGMLWHRVNASNAGQAPGGRQHTSSSTSLRRATESSEPYAIAALVQRWSGLFSYSAANAVAQLKS
jgi:hypothetical protein